MIKEEYIIKSVQPRNGELKDVHKRMLQQKCEIIELEKGYSAQFAYYTDASKTWSRMVYTSYVTDVEIHENGDLTIRTRNTVYELQKI